MFALGNAHANRARAAQYDGSRRIAEGIAGACAVEHPTGHAARTRMVRLRRRSRRAPLHGCPLPVRPPANVSRAGPAATAMLTTAALARPGRARRDRIHDLTRRDRIHDLTCRDRIHDHLPRPDLTTPPASTTARRPDHPPRPRPAPDHRARPGAIPPHPCLRPSCRRYRCNGACRNSVRNRRNLKSPTPRASPDHRLRAALGQHAAVRNARARARPVHGRHREPRTVRIDRGGAPCTARLSVEPARSRRRHTGRRRGTVMRRFWRPS